MLDYGRIVERTPARVVRPTTIADVAAAIRDARADGLPYVARGEGHTTRGQSLCDGVVIELGALRAIDIDATRRTARVGAGLTWSELVATTCAAGLTPPVLTDYLRLSVGGTLSVGGFGGQSFRHGAQTDQVESLVVVTPDGEVVECSRERERALFDACRGSLGRYGTIVEAVVRLVPAPEGVAVGKLPYPDLPAFLAAQHQLVDESAYDYILGNLLPEPGGWKYEIEVVRYDGDDAGFARMTYLDYVNRLDHMVTHMQADGSWTALHPWIDVFVPASVAPEVVGEALALFDRAELADGHVMTYPLTTTTTPLLAVPAEPHGFLFDILSNLRDRAGLPHFEARCRQIVERVRSIGGGIYPIGFPIGTPDERPGDLRTPAQP